MRQGSLLPAIAITFFFAACADGDANSPFKARQSSKSNAATAESPLAEAEAEVELDESTTDESMIVNKTVSDLGQGLQVKDISLLRSSVESCMGPGMLGISNDMLIPTDLTVSTAPLTEGRVRFLLAAQYQSGDDIILKEAGNLVDFSGSNRTNNSADGLSDTYLRSLETIGNVVAHNCTAANSHCQCATKAEALNLMARCLPGLNPNSVDMGDSASLLAAVCSENIAGMRKAIASLISSYAFAVAR